MEGYSNSTGRTTLSAGLDGWYIGNILFGGLIGMLIVDPATAAMWKLDDRIVVNLGAKTSGLLPDGERLLHVVTIDQLPHQYRRHLIRVH